MDNAGIYEYAFHCMLSHISHSKEQFTQAQSTMNDIYRPVLFSADDNTRLYSTVMNASERSVLLEMSKLVMRLFENNNVEYERFPHDDIKDDPLYECYMPFYRVEEGEKVAYLFDDGMGARVDWKGIINKYKVDSIKVVGIVDTLPNPQSTILKDAENVLNWMVYEAEKKAEGYVEYITLADLFLLIGPDEYSAFQNHVRKYNEDVRKLIGYSTVTIPSDETLNRFKKDRLNWLRSFDYTPVSSRIINRNDAAMIDTRYLQNDLVRAVVGSLPFAESFISAEWYYNTHIATSGLEQTAIVVGYLKSIEQLLYSLVQLLPQNQQPNLSEMKTLGDLNVFVNRDPNLWIVSVQTVRFIFNQLDYYRDRYRNDHLHKDNVFDPAEIEEIRKNTVFLYYLLLGAFRINAGGIGALGLWSGPSVERGLTYEALSGWLDRILGGDPLFNKKRKTIYLCLDLTRIQLTFVDGFESVGDNGHYTPVNSQFPYICDELKWVTDIDKDIPWDDRESGQIRFEETVGEMLKRFYRESKNAERLKKFDVCYGFFGNCYKAEP